jgi:hypothetical protein
MDRHVWIDERLAEVPLFEGLSKQHGQIACGCQIRWERCTRVCHAGMVAQSLAP